MDDESFDEQIPDLEARNRDLAAHLENLQMASDSEGKREAHYFHLVKDNERMEREIAKLEGRTYRQEDGSGDADYQDPPEPPDA